ncbi:MAG: hypothetical protein JNK87_05090 [Bryobacterales bacterium]|nr:hypothetical protein [Bryobacterales bacterium]
MLTPEQKADIARRNGAKSQGPISAQGKDIVSRNALQHGLAAHKHIVLDCEDDTAFSTLRQGCIDKFHPTDPFEFELVEQIAVGLWRTRRAFGLDTATLDQSLATSIDNAAPEDDTAALLAKAFHHAGTEGSLNRLHRYESAAQRAVDRALARLDRYRAKPGRAA